MENKQPTYGQQWQKVTSAYLNDELNPYIQCACFIGNILNETSDWGRCRTMKDDAGTAIVRNYKDKISFTFYVVGEQSIKKESAGLYTPLDIVKLENNFLKILWQSTENRTHRPDEYVKNLVKAHPNYENALFEAMTSTLEMLRKIHISKGENVDAIPLKKRELNRSFIG
jgi:hypothetical protein